MSIQVQKKALRQVGAKISKKLVSWPSSLILEAPAMLLVIIFGLVLYLQPAPAHISIHTQTASNKKVTHPAFVKPKVAKPKKVVPKSSVIPPATYTTTATTQTAASTATPKVEPVVTPSPRSKVSGLKPKTTTTAPSGSSTPGAQVTTGYTSLNWSGYMAANASFTGISASWHATMAAGNGSTTSADSTWIGIGGVTSEDLIQVGTQNTISASGKVSASAFYELLPDYAQTVPGVTVSEGDSITASLTQISSGHWAISITDNTDDESYNLTVTYNSSLSSAEWIEEDPSYGSGRLVPFDSFSAAYFTAGYTVADGKSVNIGNSTAQPVILVNNSGQNIAVPSIIGGDGASFTVTP